MHFVEFLLDLLEFAKIVDILGLSDAKTNKSANLLLIFLPKNIQFPKGSIVKSIINDSND